MTPTSKEHVRGEYLAQLTAQCGMISYVQHEGKEVVRKGERKEMTWQSESSLLPDRLPTFTQITLPLSVNSPPLSSCAGRTPLHSAATEPGCRRQGYSVRWFWDTQSQRWFSRCTAAFLPRTWKPAANSKSPLPGDWLPWHSDTKPA